MAVEKITIRGYRGFSTRQTFMVAQPSGAVGSGLTILVGPNNSGKSSVIESIMAFTGYEAPTFSEGKRNRRTGNKVAIAIHSKEETYRIRTISAGGSETTKEPNYPFPNLYVLPSRRYFDPYFGKSELSRQDYERLSVREHQRSNPINNFASRLFSAVGKQEFNNILSKLIGAPFNWTIEQSDQGGYYLKCIDGKVSHNSDGLGEGIVSLIFIVDAIYDAPDEGIIVIDEPELSLHPAYQQRLAQFLAEEAKDKQIIYATHSPYFVDFEHILNGAEISRVHKSEDKSVISRLSRGAVEGLRGLLIDSHNPHVLGIKARETFFREDGVVLVEGQDDVVYYVKVLEQLVADQSLSEECASDLKERLFGWGVGGAEKSEKILKLLNDLGFEKVATVFDKNKKHLIPTLNERFAQYHFDYIPADDVRTKENLDGLLDESNMLREEFKDRTVRLFQKIHMHILG